MYQPTPKPPNNQWDVYAEQARQQLPAAPESLLNGYVRWAPWVAIVFGAFGVLALLVLGGILTFLSPLFLLGGSEGISSGIGALISVVIGLVLAVLEVVGGYLMLKSSLTGWWLLAIGIALSVITNLFKLSIFGLLISLLIAYVHLQVKPRYQ